VTCPAQARLAAAASGEDAAAVAHTRDCLSCRVAYEQQRIVIAAARAMQPVRLRPERRAELAAEVMAQGDLDAPRWRGERVMAVVSSVVAVAAVVTLVLAGRAPAPEVPFTAAAPTADEPAVRVVRAERQEPVAEPVRAAVTATGAVFAREQRGDQDVVTLADGEVSVDSTDREPVTIVAGDTRVVITSSRAKVVARRGVIVTTHVFAGTAQVTSKGRSVVIASGDVWMRDPEAATPHEAAAAPGDSLASFRQGWEDLRAHHYPQAIAAFDRATDPVVAEDAAFWAAIATERAGDNDGAATRLRAFLERFPQSLRADAARAGLARVTK
jgi:hypothetical protein